MLIKYVAKIEEMCGTIQFDEVAPEILQYEDVEDIDLLMGSISLDDSIDTVLLYSLLHENKHIGYLGLPCKNNGTEFEYDSDLSSGVGFHFKIDSSGPKTKLLELNISWPEGTVSYSTQRMRAGHRIYIGNDSNSEISNEINEYIEEEDPDSSPDSTYSEPRLYFVTEILQEDHLIICFDDEDSGFANYSQPFLIIGESKEEVLSPGRILLQYIQVNFD